MLKRELGFWSTVAMAVGNTAGVFVLLGVGAAIAGPFLPLAFAIAGLLAFLCAASAAELGVVYPLAGGAYEYARNLVSPGVGFISGILFMVAKILEAATIALVFGAYFALFLKVDPRVIAAISVVIFTWINYLGIRPSSKLNNLLVVIKVAVLGVLVAFALNHLSSTNFSNFSGISAGNVFTASALMFFAYTGFARIGTLGEEIKNPKKVIPKATMTALAITTVIYLVICVVAIAVVGSKALAGSASPLAVVASQINYYLAVLVIFGALIATAAVVLGDVLISSRTLFAMGRRGEMPHFLEIQDKKNGTPTASVVASGIITFAVVSLGSLTFAATLTALTMLLYYVITNFTALKLAKRKRLYPGALPALGVFGCLALAICLPLEEWVIVSLVVLAAIVYYISIKRR
jgi:APA family basic amino acid/polyamine antiporter